VYFFRSKITLRVYVLSKILPHDTCINCIYFRTVHYVVLLPSYNVVQYDMIKVVLLILVLIRKYLYTVHVGPTCTACTTLQVSVVVLS
jgi:hypothetical protein